MKSTKKKITVKVQPKKSSIKEPKLTIKELKLEDILPNNIDRVDIYNDNGKAGVYLASNIGSESFKHWLKNRGGIILKDLNMHLKKGITHKYAIITKDLERFIVRFIDKDEYPLFSSLKLVNGKVKNIHYMIIKNLKEDEQIKSYGLRYIQENTDISSEKILTINSSSDDDENDYEKNLSVAPLFED